jgi:hypothetical protein
VAQQERAHPVVETVLWLTLVLLVAMGVSLGLAAGTARGPYDPYLHSGGSMLLTVVFLMAAVWRPGRGDGWFPHGDLTIVALIITVGVGIEVAQTAGKIGVDSLGDIALDTAGTVAGWLVWRYLRYRLTTSQDGTSDSLGS